MRHGCLTLGGRQKTAKACPSTFSLVARDPDNGDLGVIVQSKFPAVVALVLWASAGVGAVATRALASTSYGPSGLEFMSKGNSAGETLKFLLQHDDKEMVEHRQVGIVDAKGRAVAYAGRSAWSGLGTLFAMGTPLKETSLQANPL